MNRLTAALFDLKQLEQLATGSSPVHRLHPGAKVVTTLLFIVSVVSFQRYEVSALLPFLIFPLIMSVKAEVPFRLIAGKVVIFLPFVLFVGIWNPLFDRATLFTIGTIPLSGGTVSFVSLIIRSLLTISAAFILIATTGFNAICQTMQQFGMPQVFVNQLMFLYRYLFVLAEEASRAALARELRSCGTQGQGIASYGSLTGSLLLRTWGRAERIHGAMLARGFAGEFPTGRTAPPNCSDLYYFVGCSLLLLLFRLYNVPLILGRYITGMMP